MSGCKWFSSSLSSSRLSSKAKFSLLVLKHHKMRCGDPRVVSEWPSSKQPSQKDALATGSQYSTTASLIGKTMFFTHHEKQACKFLDMPQYYYQNPRNAPSYNSNYPTPNGNGSLRKIPRILNQKPSGTRETEMSVVFPARQKTAEKRRGSQGQAEACSASAWAAGGPRPKGEMGLCVQRGRMAEARTLGSRREKKGRAVVRATGNLWVMLWEERGLAAAGRMKWLETPELFPAGSLLPWHLSKPCLDTWTKRWDGSGTRVRLLLRLWALHSLRAPPPPPLPVGRLRSPGFLWFMDGRASSNSLEEARGAERSAPGLRECRVSLKKEMIVLT